VSEWGVETLADFLLVRVRALLVRDDLMLECLAVACAAKKRKGTKRIVVVINVLTLILVLASFVNVK